jgi:hypothetical protein
LKNSLPLGTSAKEITNSNFKSQIELKKEKLVDYSKFKE